MTVSSTTAPRAAELHRAVEIVAGMIGDAEARRDTAFACMAELLRLGHTELAQAMSAELHRRVPDDPETAFLPPDPPPGLSPATHWAFDADGSGPIWPWDGPETARARLSDPSHCAGLGAWHASRGRDGWLWAETGAANAVDFLADRGRAPGCEPLGTFLAWLVAGEVRSLCAGTIPLELRPAWPFSYPEARRFVRPDDASAAATARLAAALVAEGQARSEAFRAWAVRFISPSGSKTGDSE